MSTHRSNEHDVDKLLKQVLKDDLPSETEFRLRKRLAAFRRALEPSDDPRAVRSAGSRRRPPAFVQWLNRHRVFRKEALAYLSSVMLASGAMIHLGGFQSVLADSITLLKTSMSLTEQIRLARSMDCVVKMTSPGTQAAICHIRWVRDGGTRVDVESARGVDETLWITQGHVTVANLAAGLSKPTAYSTPGLQEPVIALLSPAELARRMDESWQLQPEKKQHNPDRLVFNDRQDRAVIEIRFDRKSFLPTSLIWKPPEANGRAWSEAVPTTAELTWNQPIEPDLMVPGLKPGR
jgi:hypothetical protein